MLFVHETAKREVSRGFVVIKVVPGDEQSPGRSCAMNCDMRMINAHDKVVASAHYAAEVDLDEIGCSHNGDRRGPSDPPASSQVAMSAL
jgi:hypothetical protein